MADTVVAEQHKKSGLSQNVGQTKTLINQGLEGILEIDLKQIHGGKMIWK